MAGYDEKARLARAILDNGQHRRHHLPSGIFGEYAWGALLQLFIANAASERLTGHCLAQLTGCAPSVMARWLIYLSQQNLIVGDGKGDLYDMLTLCPKALDAVEGYLAQTQLLARQFFEAGDLG